MNGFSINQFTSLRGRLLSLLAITLFLSSCATTSLKFSVVANKNINPGVDGQPYAVLVRFYQLNDPAIFEKASYANLWKNDVDVLGVTLLNKKELVMEPGVSMNVTLAKADQTKYIGLVAFYRDFKKQQWKAVKKVNYGFIPASTQLKILLDDNKLDLQYR